MATSPSFSVMFSNGDNFHDLLFGYPENEVFQKWDLLLKKEFAPREQILFFKCCSLMRWEAKMKMTELLPLKVYCTPEI